MYKFNCGLLTGGESYSTGNNVMSGERSYPIRLLISVNFSCVKVITLFTLSSGRNYFPHPQHVACKVWLQPSSSARATSFTLVRKKTYQALPSEFPLAHLSSPQLHYSHIYNCHLQYWIEKVRLKLQVSNILKLSHVTNTPITYKFRMESHIYHGLVFCLSSIVTPYYMCHHNNMP